MKPQFRIEHQRPQPAPSISTLSLLLQHRLPSGLEDEEFQIVIPQLRATRNLCRPQRRRLVLRRLQGLNLEGSKLWNFRTGEQRFSLDFKCPARSIEFSVGDRLAVITTYPFIEFTSNSSLKTRQLDWFLCMSKGYHIFVSGDYIVL